MDSLASNLHKNRHQKPQRFFSGILPTILSQLINLSSNDNFASIFARAKGCPDLPQIELNNLIYGFPVNLLSCSLGALLQSAR